MMELLGAQQGIGLAVTEPSLCVEAKVTEPSLCAGVAVAAPSLRTGAAVAGPSVYAGAAVTESSLCARAIRYFYSEVAVLWFPCSWWFVTLLCAWRFIDFPGERRFFAFLCA
jgi:hypothetical protein